MPAYHSQQMCKDISVFIFSNSHKRSVTGCFLRYKEKINAVEKVIAHHFRQFFAFLYKPYAYLVHMAKIVNLF